MPAAYYNEIDPFAAQWLRNLIKAGHIAPGYVDERSISDIKPSDLAGFSQVHFFAGIGVWSLALRRAGWPDDRPVWTGSCPCQPFSSAGAGAGFADERHLWPHFHWLIDQCRPPTVLGEQVASKDAEPWIDLVQDDMEAMGYAFGAIPFPSASVGAPHIRDRLYWMAHTHNPRLERWQRVPKRTAECSSWQSGVVKRLANNNQHGCAALPLDRGHDEEHHTEPCCELCGMADAKLQQRPIRQRTISPEHEARGREQGTAEAAGLCSDSWMANAKQHSSRCEAAPADHLWTQADRSANQHCGYSGAFVRLGDSNSERAGRDGGSLCGALKSQNRKLCTDHAFPSSAASQRPGPVNGFWRDADWLLCRDGKWRPVEPGAFPLVAKSSSSMGRMQPALERLFSSNRRGRLKGYGNAINAQAAQVFIEAAMSCIDT